MQRIAKSNSYLNLSLIASSAILLLLVMAANPMLLSPYSAYAQSTSVTAGDANPSPNPNGYNACQNYPQQSQGQIPPFCAKLIVIKNVIGGIASPSDFTLSVAGNMQSQTPFQGSSSGTTIILAPGSYQITEVGGPSGYVQVHGRHRCDIGTIAAGQTITCTITNIFASPQVLSFTAVPSVVSLSSGGTITISAHVTDAAGIQRVGVFIQDECGGSPGFFQALTLPLVSGTPQDGIYQATFTFPSSALNVNHFCDPNLAFQIGGIAVDTLGNQVGLPLQGVILTP